MQSESNSLEIKAKSLDLAIIKAAGSLGVSQAEVAYEILSEKKGGFLGLFSKPTITINAWLKKPKQDSRRARSHGPAKRFQENGNGRDRFSGPKPSRRNPRENPNASSERSSPRFAAPESEQPKVELTPAQQEELFQELVSFCEGICTHMVGEPVKVSSQIRDDRLILNVEHDGIADMIQKNSRVAEALEHLLRKKPRHIHQELPFRIFIDAGSTRQNREQTLIQMAGDLSEKVHENRRPIVLNYRSPYDRKIIHMALDKDDRVYTKSIGNGHNRKLMILPASDGSTPESSEAPLEINEEL